MPETRLSLARPFEAATAALVAGAAGVVVARSPGLAFGSVLAAGGGIAVLAAPPAFLPALVVLAAAAGAPVVLLAQRGSLSTIGSAFAGEGKIVALLAAVAVGRVVVRRTRLVLPRRLVVATFAYFAFQLAGVAVGTAFGHPARPALHALLQQVSYPAAFVVGTYAAATAVRDDAFPRLQRTLGCVALIVNVLVCWYWAWAARLFPAPPALSRLFELAAAAGSRYGDRSVFPFVDDSPNLGAVAVAILSAFVFPQLVHERSRRGRWLAAAVAVTGTAAVLATQSRSGLISLTAGAAVYVFVSRHGRQQRQALVVLALALAVGLQGYRLLPQERRISLNAPTLQTRQVIWRQALASIGRHPFTGEGFHFAASNPFIQPITNPGPLSPAARKQSVHSQYLEAAVDGGILGEIVLLALLASLVALAKQALGSAVSRDAAAGLLAALAALLVSMTVGSSLDSAVVAILVWLEAGVVAGAGAVPRRAAAVSI